ncbi:hypothetical protein GEMRC1_003849 [Eukaryota sp. GEM-RC1]
MGRSLLPVAADEQLSVNSFHPQWQLNPEPSIAMLDPPIPQDPPLDTSSELMFLWNSIESLSSIQKGLLIPKLKQLLSEQQRPENPRRQDIPQRGRPRNPSRNQTSNEVVRADIQNIDRRVTCTVCGQRGHNRRTCVENDEPPRRQPRTQ